MAYSNRRWTFAFSLTMRIYSVQIFAVFAAAYPSAGIALQAAPLTFQFEAEVASVISIDGGVVLPFAVSAGDPIVATFTFESSIGGPHFPQHGGLRFDIAGHAVNIPDYTISVHDEAVPNATPVTGSMADPLNTPIGDQAPGSSDDTYLTCPIPQGSYCGALVGFDELGVRPVIGLSTDANVFDSDNLVADLNVWNAFSFRELSLSFRNLNAGGEIYIGAYIGSIEQVPEPRSMLLALISAVISASYFGIRVHRFVKTRRYAGPNRCFARDIRQFAP